MPRKKLLTQKNYVVDAFGRTYIECIAPSFCSECKGECCKIGYDPLVCASEKELALISVHPHNKELAQAKMLGLKSPELKTCSFLSEEGCVIPREQRPRICREYRCEKIDAVLEYEEKIRYNREKRAARKSA